MICDSCGRERSGPDRSCTCDDDLLKILQSQLLHAEAAPTPAPVAPRAPAPAPAEAQGDPEPAPDHPSPSGVDDVLLRQLAELQVRPVRPASGVGGAPPGERSPRAPAPDAAAPLPAVSGEEWRDDPAVPGQQRWFDGQRWTASTRPAPGTAPPAAGGVGGTLPPPLGNVAAPITADRLGGGLGGPAPGAGSGWTAPGPVAPTTITFGAPPSRFDLARLAPVAALVAVIVVLAAGLAAVTRHHPVGRWDGRVTDLVSFVETERGLTFKHPVPVEFLPVATFKKKVGTTKPMSAADRRQLEAAVGELRALGLAAGPLDLQALERQLVEEGVIGLYRPADKRIYVRGTDLTPAVKVTLVHELTHALQDQHVDLGKIGRGTSASESSIRALVEGDAVQVERAYVRQLSPDERQSYIDASENDRSSADLGGIPQVLIDDFSFPYAFGPTFIAALKAFGGTASIDAALRRPPVTDAQIVNPDLYLTNTKVVAVATPSVPKGDEVVGRPQRFGIVDMLQVLGARVGFSQAWSALKGWRGDREVLYRDHGNLCVAVATAVDTPASADALSAALAAWSKAVPGGTSTRDGDVVALRACDPGTAAPALPSATPEPFKVLAARAGIIEGVLQSPSIPASAAACAADAVIAALSPAAVVAADEGERSLDPAAVRTALAGAVAGCGLSRAGSRASTPTTVAPPQPSVRLDRPLGAALTAPPVWPTPADARAAVAAAGLAMLDGEGTAIHEHAHLRVVIDGQEVVVPGEIGIDASRGLLSPLHTHNTSGIVHIESDEPEPFTVGQVFTEWGRPIGRDHIGSMHFGADRTMHVFVNGAEVTGDPSLVVWHEHDDVVIDVERTGASVPVPRHYIWPPGF